MFATPMVARSGLRPDQLLRMGGAGAQERGFHPGGAPMPMPGPNPKPVAGSRRSGGMFASRSGFGPEALGPTYSTPGIGDGLGRGMSGAAPDADRKGMDWKRFIGTFAAGLASANGNPMGYAFMQAMNNQDSLAAKAREQEEERRAAVAERQRLMGVLIGKGLSEAEAELALLNPESLGSAFSSRFQTRELSPEQSVVTPGMAPGQRPSLYTAPKIFEDGPNRVQVDPNAGTSRMVHQGKTDAEWAAERIGLKPGSAEWGTFLRDYELDAQGPTAVAIDRERTATTRRGQDVSAGTALRGQDMTDARGRRGQDMSDARGRRGQDMTDERVRRGQDLRGRGRGRGRGGGAVIVNPQTGQRMRLEGGRWVPAR